jgi:hypothetical protein
MAGYLWAGRLLELEASIFTSMKPINVRRLPKTELAASRKLDVEGVHRSFQHVRLFAPDASLNISYSIAASPPRPSRRSRLRTPLSLHVYLNQRIAFGELLWDTTVHHLSEVL